MNVSTAAPLRARLPINFRIDPPTGVRIAIALQGGDIGGALTADLGEALGLVIDVDTSYSEELRRGDGVLMQIAESLAAALGDRPLRRYYARSRDVEDDRRMLQSFRVAGFQAGSDQALLQQLRVLGQPASPSEPAQHSGTEALPFVSRLFGKLGTTDFSLDRVLRPGEIILEALLKDVADARRSASFQVCIHLASAERFPGRVFDSLRRLIKRAEAAAAVQILVSGLPDARYESEWPLERVVVPPATAPSPALRPMRNGLTLDWSFGPYRADVLVALVPPEDHRQLELALAGVAISSLLSAELLYEQTGWPFPQCAHLIRALRSYFGGTAGAPMIWRKYFVSRLAPLVPALEQLGSSSSIPAAAEATHEVVAACLTTYVAVRDARLIDYAICCVVRRETRSIASLLDSLSLLYSSASFLRPDQTEAIHQRMIVLRHVILGDSRAREVIEYFETVCREAPAEWTPAVLAEAHYQRGYLYYLSREDSLARAALARACEIEPTHHRALNVSGLIAMGKRKKLGEALALFGQSIDVDGNYPYSWYNAGVAYEQVGEELRAAQHLIACLFIEPDFYEAHFNLSNVLLTLGCLREAGAIAQAGATLGRWCETEILSNLAISYIEAGHVREGQLVLEEAFRQNPTDYLKFNLAYCLYLRKDFDKAAEWIKRVNRRALSAEHQELVRALSDQVAARDWIEPEPPAAFEDQEALQQLCREVDRLIEFLEENGFRRQSRVERHVASVASQRRSPQVSEQPERYGARRLRDFEEDLIDFAKDDAESDSGKPLQEWPERSEPAATPRVRNRERQATPEALATQAAAAGRVKRLPDPLVDVPIKVRGTERGKQARAAFKKRLKKMQRQLQFIRLPSYSGG